MSEAIPSDQPLPLKASAKQIIAHSQLPPAAATFMTDLLRRTRLWKREKAEVAQELVAHFHDGIQAGRSVEDLIHTFGQPRLVAKLIARGKKRNRPLWWHLRRRMFHVLLLLVAFYVLVGLLLSIRQPRISVDYVAELNKNIPSLPQDQYAWPIYRKALIEEREKQLGNIDFSALDSNGDSLNRNLRPADPDWPRAVAELDRHKALLEAAQIGGLKPAMGLKVGFKSQFSDEDWKAFGWVPTRLSSPDQLIEQTLIAVLLPNLTPMRQMAELLTMDSLRASAAGDSQRIVQNYRATLGLARQVREMPLLVNSLVAAGICKLADEALMEMLAANPQLLRGRQVALLHEMGTTQPLYVLDVATERYMLRDVVQRIYSDDGEGDGSVTLDGLRLLNAIRPLMASTSGATGLRGSVPRAEDLVTLPPLLPAAAVLMASRRDITAKAESYYAAVEQDARRPLWERLRSPSDPGEQVIEWKMRHPYRYLLLTELLPALDRAAKILDEYRALHEATMVALALNLWHERHGQYPDALAEMVPEYLPQMPLDHSTGQPLRYTIKDGRPLLYGLGKDGKDDGGVWQDKHWPRLPEKGDWVLYPPVKDD